ncbi:MAG: potassium transporter TrkH [Desulfohalobiaceae bacterium]|nr:potassium transporter TrkH [Desulfohalobiaceae bacterium]
MIKHLLSPFAWPIIFFGLAIVAGSIALHHPAAIAGPGLSWLDAVFTATSATCVTGLIVVDTGSYFTRFGQSVIMILIQLGGLGVMTYTSLIFYLWRRRVSLTDRLALGQSLLHDPSFRLGRFFIQLVLVCLSLEGIGFILMYLAVPGFGLFEALFHAVSAFCNAGFALQEDSLTAWRGLWTVNLIFMVLIVLGGLGFSVLIELAGACRRAFRQRTPVRMTWYARIILRTSLWLILAGAVIIFLSEWRAHPEQTALGERIFSALFQSVTARTAGFNTVSIGEMSNVSLLALILLMFVGGSPGSCAGGIKITTFRALLGFGAGRLRGRRQTVVAGSALDEDSLNKALTLVFFASGIVVLAMLLLVFLEGADLPHPETRGMFLEIAFEVFSAFGTVGLSTGVTSGLSEAGRAVIIGLMFVGRLGPILFLSMLQSWHKQEHFSWPESNLLVG